MTRHAKASEVDRRVREAVEGLPAGRRLLAVSGGRDSMSLLDAFARWRPAGVTVATFDHGTSPEARRSAALVADAGERLGLPVAAGSATGLSHAGEAEWRDARWRFLTGWARELEARVVTAHTLDDQVETVTMRILRDSGPRGLAGMYAASEIERPFLGLSRDDVATYAERHEVAFVEDPSNADRRHLRNRVRLDLLPALERARPGFRDWLVDVSRRAAAWRGELESVVASLSSLGDASVSVLAESLEAMPPEALAVLWPAIAARAGVTLDWRGTERLVDFTPRARVRARVQLSGGAEAVRTPTTFVVRNPGGSHPLY